MFFLRYTVYGITLFFLQVIHIHNLDQFLYRVRQIF